MIGACDMISSCYKGKSFAWHHFYNKVLCVMLYCAKCFYYLLEKKILFSSRFVRKLFAGLCFYMGILCYYAAYAVFVSWFIKINLRKNWVRYNIEIILVIALYPNIKRHIYIDFHLNTSDIPIYYPLYLQQQSFLLKI